MLSDADAEIQALVNAAVNDAVHAAAYYAQAAAMKVIKAFFQNLLNPGPQL